MTAFDLRQHSCSRKRRYGARWSAYLAQQSAERRTGQRMDIYKCCYCRGWHIGHFRPMPREAR